MRRRSSAAWAVAAGYVPEWSGQPFRSGAGPYLSSSELLADMALGVCLTGSWEVELGMVRIAKDGGRNDHAELGRFLGPTNCQNKGIR